MNRPVACCGRAAAVELWQRLADDAAAHCTLAEILAAREERVARQAVLLARHKLPLISFTLNIAGAVKSFPLADAAFAEGLAHIERGLERLALPVVAREIAERKTGCEALLAVDGEARAIKERMTALEESHPLGRLFDIDILCDNGVKLSREDMGYGPRACLVCGLPGKDCARSHAHTLEAVIRRTLELLLRHADERAAERTANLALRCLLYEACTTPKPGLVDRENTGSHRDMDLFTLMESASVLHPYFRRCALAGLESGDGSPDSLFLRLRRLGMEAEDAMFAATGGVNTHKGAIFLLGVLTAAAGRVHASGEPCLPEKVAETGAAITAALRAECRALAQECKDDASHGERLLPLGIDGARGEAAGGFASALRVGLPTLEKRLAAGDSPERAGAVTLVHLMAHVIDTNAVTRTSVARQEALRAELRSLLQDDPAPSDDTLRRLDRRLTGENCSHGGCADLLAASWFLLLLGRETEAGE